MGVLRFQFGFSAVHRAATCLRFQLVSSRAPELTAVVKLFALVGHGKETR